MSDKHVVIIIPFMKGGKRYLVVKSNIPQNTSMLIQGDRVEDVMNSFFARYGYEILLSIRHGRMVSFSIAEPTGAYWILAKELIRVEGLEGSFTFYPLHDRKYVEREITIACKRAITPVPP
jgi:hypothetical protein